MLIFNTPDIDRVSSKLIKLMKSIHKLVKLLPDSDTRNITSDRNGLNVYKHSRSNYTDAGLKAKQNIKPLPSRRDEYMWNKYLTERERYR